MQLRPAASTTLGCMFKVGQLMKTSYLNLDLFRSFAVQSVAAQHGLPLALALVAFLSISALLSFVSSHVIEDPMIRLGKCLTELKRYVRVFDSIQLTLQPAAVVLAGSQPSVQQDLAPLNHP